MAKFEDCIDQVLDNEGGLVDNPSDLGGITNFGISLKFYQTIKLNATPDDIKQLSKDSAIQIYRKLFWDKNKYNLIANQQIAAKVFDACVTMGAFYANRCLQRAVRAASGRSLTEDGVLGTLSLYAINMSPADAVIAAFKSEVANYYRALVADRPNQSLFLKGWLNRAYSSFN